MNFTSSILSSREIEADSGKNPNHLLIEELSEPLGARAAARSSKSQEPAGQRGNKARFHQEIFLDFTRSSLQGNAATRIPKGSVLRIDTTAQFASSEDTTGSSI